MTLDLTKKSTCYSYHLNNMSPSFNEMFYDEECTLPEMLDAVRATVYKAKDTNARKTFLKRLDMCGSKNELYSMCFNAVSNAKSYQT